MKLAAEREGHLKHPDGPGPRLHARVMSAGYLSRVNADMDEWPRTDTGHSEAGVEGNARLTAVNAAVLLALLAAEGLTLLGVRRMLTPHVFIGMLLIPPVLVKVGSTGWRFVRYYAHVPAYRRKGPPPVLLRLLGPFVVLLTLVLLASGVGLLLVGAPQIPLLLEVHKASFILWFCAMAIHVLGHVAEVARVAPRDWLHRGRRDVTGAGARQWLIAASLVAGALLGAVFISRVGSWLTVR